MIPIPQGLLSGFGSGGMVMVNTGSLTGPLIQSSRLNRFAAGFSAVFFGASHLSGRKSETPTHTTLARPDRHPFAMDPGTAPGRADRSSEEVLDLSIPPKRPGVSEII